MKQKLRGFTIVELVVVIAIIGILAGIVLLNMKGWKQRTETSQVQSDLKSAASAMEDARNNTNGYPTSLPSTFTASQGVTITYTSGSAAGYCINAKSTADPAVAYNIQSTGGVPAPQAGTCS